MGENACDDMLDDWREILHVRLTLNKFVGMYFLVQCTFTSTLVPFTEIKNVIAITQS